MLFLMANNSTTFFWSSYVELQYLERTKDFRSDQNFSIVFISGEGAGESHLLEIITIKFHI